MPSLHWFILHPEYSETRTYKQIHLCTCSTSGLFRTPDLLHPYRPAQPGCSGFSALLLLPSPLEMQAGRDPAIYSTYGHLGYGGTNQELCKDLPVLHLLYQPLLMQAELPGPERGTTGPRARPLGWALNVLPGPQLRSVHLAFTFWIQRPLSIVSCRSTHCIRGTVDFCTDCTESKRKSA